VVAHRCPAGPAEQVKEQGALHTDPHAARCAVALALRAFLTVVGAHATPQEHSQAQTYSSPLGVHSPM
jgi:hypothetical protein